MLRHKPRPRERSQERLEAFPLISKAMGFHTRLETLSLTPLAAVLANLGLGSASQAETLEPLILSPHQGIQPPRQAEQTKVS